MRLGKTTTANFEAETRDPVKYIDRFAEQFASAS
jgi:hypothetical protein